MNFPPAATPSVTRQLTVLLVDHDVDTRRMYAAYLQQSTCVEEAEDGREALAKAIARRPSVVVTETRLPGIDGFELCRILRQDEATRSIPIVVVTADAFGRDVHRARTSGADVVLTKPCLPEQLGCEIRRLLAASIDGRSRTRMMRGQSGYQLPGGGVLRSPQNPHGFIASRAFERLATTDPPNPPPSLVCPVCDRPLVYVRSHVGGVSARHAEQWDYFECAAGCGTFQYRHRTRRLRRVA
jgi:CheY-like chemotaxis protein